MAGILAGVPQNNATVFHAAAVPSAMATAIRKTNTILFTPELVSPKMISRIALVNNRPGTKIISEPIIMASVFVTRFKAFIVHAVNVIRNADVTVLKN